MVVVIKIGQIGPFNPVYCGFSVYIVKKDILRSVKFLGIALNNYLN